MDLATVKRLLLVVDSLMWLGRQAIDLGDFKLLRNLGTDVQWVCVVVGIWIIYKSAVKPALENMLVFRIRTQNASDVN